MIFISVFGFVFWVCLQEYIDYKRKFYQHRKEIIKGKKDEEDILKIVILGEGRVGKTSI